MDKADYVTKVDKIIQDGIRDNKYELVTVDRTAKDLHNFQQFLYRNFKKHDKYRDMYPSSHQPARFFGTAKTHKFENIESIYKDELTLRPIIDQTGTCYYNSSQILAKYLQPLAKNEYKIDDTQSFPEFLKSKDKNEDEEDVSYDVVSLFTSIPIEETIDYICDEIYIRNKLKPFHNKRLIFRNLLRNLATKCIFSANESLYRQIDGCTMGGPLSVVLSDIFMGKLEMEVVTPSQPILYGRYVDDCYVRRKKNTTDELLIALNRYHRNIQFTTEHNPSKFLDTKIIFDDNNIVTTEVYRKTNSLPAHWSSQIPKRYKRNTINTELYRAKRISSNFDKEVKIIESKFINANYPIKYVKSVIKDFNNKTTEQEDEPLIPDWLFDERKFLAIKIPFCEKNESYSKRFQDKLNDYTEGKFNPVIIWQTRKVNSLFTVKDKVLHTSNAIYEGICSCTNTYIGETDRNNITRWKEHNNPNHNSDAAKHILNNSSHSYQWTILRLTNYKTNKRRILEALYIAKYKPEINNQLEMHKLILFKHGVPG